MLGFECKKCGDSNLDEVEENVVSTTEITGIDCVVDGQVFFEYSSEIITESTDGDRYYQCGGCGEKHTMDEILEICG
jgi:hypothetical protein